MPLVTPLAETPFVYPLAVPGTCMVFIQNGCPGDEIVNVYVTPRCSVSVGLSTPLMVYAVKSLFTTLNVVATSRAATYNIKAKAVELVLHEAAAVVVVVVAYNRWNKKTNKSNNNDDKQRYRTYEDA